MTPIVIDTAEDCYCGRREWTRGPVQGNGTGVWCAVCGCMVDIVWPDSEQR